MRILIVGDSEADYLAKCHEAFRTGLRRIYNARCFGLGYEDFNPALVSFPDIQRHVYPDAEPDLVIVPFDMTPGHPAPFRFADIEKITAPKAIIFGDYWNITDTPNYRDEFVRLMVESRIDYIITYFCQPMEHFRGTAIEDRFLYLPASVDPELFNDWQMPKEYDVGFLAAGTTDYADFYPERFAIHMQLKETPGIRYLWAQHPGWQRHAKDHPIVGAGFSKAINSCHLFITTGGRYSNAHAKYVEILASRSLLLATTPIDAGALRLVDGVNYVQITPENFEDTIRHYVSKPDLCAKIATAGYETAMQYHTCYARALQLSTELKEHKKRQMRFAAPIKLHLGCGKDRMPGWLNIDLDPTADADLHLDFLKVDEVIQQESVSEARMIHSLNYLKLWEAREFFVKMFRLFQPGGKFVIETVNVENCCKKILSYSGNFADYLEGVRPLHAFGLDHFEARASYYPNSFSWTPWHLKAELELAGFTDIQILPPETHGKWRDMRVEAFKPAPQKKARRSPGSVLMLYDRELGHTTVQVRGFIHKDMYAQNGWNAIFQDVRQTSEADMLCAAQQVDIVYLLKVNSLELIRKIKSVSHAKVVFDLTDALWRSPHLESGWQNIDAILSSVDAIFSENEFVCAYGRQFKPTYSIPVVTHAENFERVRPTIAPRTDGKLRIGWVGSTGTMTALHSIHSQLKELFARHPHLELRIVGCADPKLVEQLEGVRCSVLPQYGEKEMIEEILMMDIGIFPPPGDMDDYAIRGGQKAMLYMQAGVPSVALNAGDPAGFISDGVSGVLINSPEEWLTKLDALIRSPELRRRIGERGKVAISEGHSHKHVFRTLEDAFFSVMEMK